MRSNGINRRLVHVVLLTEFVYGIGRGLSEYDINFRES
jgi:hypothetical protein